MIIRAYLRASTKEQDANRARDQLKAFASSHEAKITTFYVENESGTTVGRPELQRLISEAQGGEVLLCESVDRLSRHEHDDWKRLRAQIDSAGLRIVAADMPMTWAALKPIEGDPMMAWMQSAMTNMLLDVMAAFARKDYERRRHVQKQGIEKAKAAGLYRGKAPNQILHQKIRDMLGGRYSIRKIAHLLDCSPSTVMDVKRTVDLESARSAVEV